MGLVRVAGIPAVAALLLGAEEPSPAPSAAIRSPPPRSRGRAQVLVDRLAADPVLPGEHCLGGAFGDSLPQLRGLLGVQRAGPAAVRAALTRQRDALALALPDQRPLELGERAHHRQQQRRHRGVFAGERELLLHELHPRPPARQSAHQGAQVVEVALFPGRRAGLPLGDKGLHRRLAKIGVPPRRARNTALLELAREVPPGNIADLLGLPPQTADKWRDLAGGNWTTYAPVGGRPVRRWSSFHRRGRATCRPSLG